MDSAGTPPITAATTRGIWRGARSSGARDLGFTLDQVRERLGLADDGGQSCAAVDAIVTAYLAEIDRKLAD